MENTKEGVCFLSYKEAQAIIKHIAAWDSTYKTPTNVAVLTVCSSVNEDGIKTEKHFDKIVSYTLDEIVNTDSGFIDFLKNPEMLSYYVNQDRVNESGFSYLENLSLKDLIGNIMVNEYYFNEVKEAILNLKYLLAKHDRQ